MITKNKASIGFCLMILLGFVMLRLPVAPAYNGIKWYPYEEGMALGRNQNKKVMINFYADWCGFCKQMDRTTYSSRAVADFLGDHFIAIKVNTDKETLIASTYRVKGLPSTWFVTGDGEKIKHLPGVVPPDLFINILTFVKTESYKVMSFRKFLSRS